MPLIASEEAEDISLLLLFFWSSTYFCFKGFKFTVPI